jgi:transaldolase
MAFTLQDLAIKLFSDGADKAQIPEMAKQPWIKGFTTNPSLMKAAGVTDYVSYARELVAAALGRHISFEVFSDDIPEMIEQARVISTWGPNVYVKLPVTTTLGEQLFQAVHGLSRDGIQINLTAVFTSEQVVSGIQALSQGAPACGSVFAGRLAGASIDHRPIMRDAVVRASRSSGHRRGKSSA